MGTAPPIPQANDLVVLATVVDAVADGCVTDSAIAEAIGMAGRQGAYYPNGAASLGLIEAVQGNEAREWQLTAAGAQLVSCEAAARFTRISEAVYSSEHVITYCELYVDHGIQAVREQMEADGVGAETAQRRATTIASWIDWTLSDPDVTIEKIAAAMTGTRDRAPGVRDAYQARRRRPERAPAQLCEHCCIAVPTDGSGCQSC